MVNKWDPSEPNSIECLQIVYKVAERCNINCSYCYYFNMGDHTALERPALVSVKSAQRLAKWLAAGCISLKIPNVHISYHGGEPMLIKPRRFDEICKTFRNYLEPIVNIRFSIQTNGTILNSEWLDVFKRHRISLGISIDGERNDHDRYRLGHRGESTFDKTEATIKRLMVESINYPFLRPSSISVLDKSTDYSKAYRYLRSLGIVQMHFLLPDRNIDDYTLGVDVEAADIGAGLVDLFTEWLVEDNQNINIRLFSQVLSYFRLDAPLTPVRRRRKTNQVLVARGDDTIVIDDSYIPALDWYSTVPNFHISEMDLRGVLQNPIFQAIEYETNRLPHSCTECNWKDICRGGDLENRFSQRNGFDNPSVYCKTYKTLFLGICNLLVKNGYPETEIQHRFGDVQHV